MSTEAAFLGTVQNVQGATVSVELANETIPGLAFIDGYGYRIGQVGSFVRIPMGYVDLYGVVSQVGAAAVPERLLETEPYGRRWITVELVGEGTGRQSFERGLSQYPTYGDKVYLVTEPDLAKLYGRSNSPNLISVGHIASAENIPALVDANRLVTRHTAVVGATGAGKSTTVAGLILALADPTRFPSARIIVFDIHGEYEKALADRAAIYRVSPRPGQIASALYIPYWAMTFDELVSLTLGIIDDASRGAITQKIYDLKLASLTQAPRAGLTAANVTVDSPVPFSIHQFWLDLYNLVNATHTAAGSGQSSDTIAYAVENGLTLHGDAMGVVAPRYKPQTQAGAEKIYLSGSTLTLRRQLDSLASKLRDPRFDFMFRPGPWLPTPTAGPPSDLAELLRGWIGGENPVTVLDLSGIPATVLTELIGVLVRITFDALFWARNLSEGGRERPLLLVLEEAHTYLSKGNEGFAAQAIQRVVKEGRKYGVGAMIVSQRPAEIDTTVLSQCGTIFAMRLANSVDRGHVTAAVTDNLTGLLSMLPALRTGEAIIVGEAVQLPVRAMIDAPSRKRRPDSSDPLIVDEVGPGGWNRQREPGAYDEVVRAWRSQNPQSPKLILEGNGGDAARPG